METTGFREGLRALTDLARHERVAIMCAEAVWWRCHRSMVADALLVMGWDVQHIMTDGTLRPHRLTAPARIVRGELTYHLAREASAPEEIRLIACSAEGEGPDD